ncbi:VOC family protein [Bacillus sp. BRMEA1]|uniref:VOC family protein n=1 Tax=Neobacillus endophyticus TaxID=2738405 RepID=UPI00156619AA|nr:VOC family protein [Neobacillus endophyticus]NRD79150.1 VOC family protein [Neobacillus endophyticus]
MALTKGVNHVGLSVTNLKETKDFFVDILEFQVLKYIEGDYAFVTDGNTMITLWQTAEETADVKTAGLHHLAFQVESVDLLRKIEERMKQKKIRLQFDGIGVRGQEGGFIALFCYEPSGIRIELATTEKDQSGDIPIIGGCGVID